MSEDQSENENQEELDHEIKELYDKVQELRQQTNFDVIASMKSAKTLLYEEYTKCIQVASTIFAVYSRSNNNQISVPCYDQEKQTQKFTKNFFHYKNFYNHIYSTPKLFAEAVYDRILNEKVDIQLISFEILPILYGYYIDESCCLKAQEFLITIIKLISDNEKLDELPKFQSLFESFFLGAYRFHDLLWNNLYNYYLKDNDVTSIFDLFKRSLENAALSLYYHQPVLFDLIDLSSEFGFKFIISGILKPSLIIYKNLFSGTNIFEQLLEEFQSIEYSPPDSKMQSIHNSFFGSTAPIQYSIDITSISFDQGLPVTFLCGTFAKLIRLTKSTDKIIEDIAYHFENIEKTVNELERNKQQTMSLPNFYPNAIMKEFTIEEPSDEKLNAVWMQIKKNANETSVDPLNLIPILNPDCDHITGITETIEFAKFALGEELKELSCKKDNLDYIIGLTMTYNSIQTIEKILENITKHANDTYLHVIMKDHLQISPNLRANKISSTFRNVSRTIQKMGLPLESAWVPSFVTVLDNVTSMPINKKLGKMFNNAKWPIKDKLRDQSEELEKIKIELDHLSKIIKILINCPCGQQFWKIFELSNSISILQAICDESNIDLSHNQIFAYIFPIECGADFVYVIIRLYQIRKLLMNNDVQFPLKIFEKINLVNSWLMSFLQTDSTFDVDLYSREIDKAFG